jgi:hypothetical protein
MHLKNRTSDWTACVGRAFALVGSLLMLHCGPSTPAAVAYPVSGTGPGQECKDDLDCREVGKVPVCANGQTCFCNENTDECAYHLSDSAGCVCIEGDVRECKRDGKPGLKRCKKVTDLTTKWSSCDTATAPSVASATPASSATTTTTPAAVPSSSGSGP